MGTVRTWRVRDAVSDDTAAIAGLITEINTFYELPYVPEDVLAGQVHTALFSGTPIGFALLAEGTEGRVIAMASYSCVWPAGGAQHSLFLSELFVSKAWRGQGVGTALMTTLTRCATERPGCTRLDWTTDQDNTEARDFYRRRGAVLRTGKLLYAVETPTCRAEGPP